MRESDVDAVVPLARERDENEGERDQYTGGYAISLPYTILYVYSILQIYSERLHICILLQLINSRTPFLFWGTYHDLGND